MHYKSRAAHFTFADLQRSIVHAQDVLHHRKADAVAVDGFIGAHTALQHPIGIFRGDTLPVIFHPQFQPGMPVKGVGKGSGGYCNTVMAPFAGVIHQVAQKLHQIAFVAMKHGVALYLD
jgi:hypothetical protein